MCKWKLLGLCAACYQITFTYGLLIDDDWLLGSNCDFVRLCYNIYTTCNVISMIAPAKGMTLLD